MNETLKTTVLLSTLTAILVVIGFLIGRENGAFTFLLIGLVINVLSYWFSDKIALSMAGARPVSRQQLPQVYAMADEVCLRMNIPVPQLYVSAESQPNAFATGRDPQHSAVCFTQGILQILPPNELKGVLAHELAHIKNRDVLTSTIAAVIAGAISGIAQIGLYFGGGDDENQPNPIVMLAMVIFAPLAATIIQFAISRTREFAADATAAQSTGDPQSLANALVRIHQGTQQIPMNVNPALSSLFIASPFSGRSLFKLFSTHPPVEERVARLVRS